MKSDHDILKMALSPEVIAFLKAVSESGRRFHLTNEEVDVVVGKAAYPPDLEDETE